MKVRLLWREETAISRVTLHITSECFEPGQQVWLAPSRLVQAILGGYGGSQSSLLHRQIDLYVPMCGLNAGMPQPAAHDIEVDAALQQVECRRVAPMSLAT